MTKEAGGTTNLYKTQYAYSRLAFGTQLERIEQAYSGGWVNSNKTQYQWDTLGRQAYEQRYDWVSGAWSTKYDITQAYDKNGNRTGYDKNVAGGSNAAYGKQYNLSYTFDNVNSLSSIADADDGNYSCAGFNDRRREAGFEPSGWPPSAGAKRDEASDANGNITQVDESTSGIGAGALHTYFEYDALNRLAAYKTKKNTIPGVTSWTWTKRVWLAGRDARPTGKAVPVT